MNNAITLPRPSVKGIRARDYILPAAIALACAGAAYAGADTTFDPALQKFTDFLEGSGGKIITVLSLAGGLIALASDRFALGQVAVPVGVGIGVGTGVPIVTSVVTATIFADVTPAAPQPSVMQRATEVPATERVKQLQELLDAGMISQSDFDAKKAELLDRIVAGTAGVHVPVSV